MVLEWGKLLALDRPSSGERLDRDGKKLEVCQESASQLAAS